MESLLSSSKDTGWRREEGQTPHNGRVTGDPAGEGCASEGRGENTHNQPGLDILFLNVNTHSLPHPFTPPFTQGPPSHIRNSELSLPGTQRDQ